MFRLLLQACAFGILLITGLYNPFLRAAMFGSPQISGTTDYNGPNIATYVVATRIGARLYRFPRNFIIGNLNGLRLGLDLTQGGGVQSENVQQFERWGGGSANTPTLVEAEVTTGLPSILTSDFRQSLKAQHPIASLRGLLKYRLGPDSPVYVPSSGEQILIICDELVGDCYMKFDVTGGNGVRVLFSRTKLADWQNIESFVRDIVEKHGSDST